MRPGARRELLLNGWMARLHRERIAPNIYRDSSGLSAAARLPRLAAPRVPRLTRFPSRRHRRAASPSCQAFGLIVTAEPYFDDLRAYRPHHIAQVLRTEPCGRLEIVEFDSWRGRCNPPPAAAASAVCEEE
jgi:hypothetical protein